MKPRIKKVLFILALLSPIAFIYGQPEDRRLRLREFVVMGYQGIQLELSSGKGPYVRTLLELLNTPASAEKKTVDQLKSLVKTHPNIMDFADQVALLEGVASAEAAAMANVPVPSGPDVFSGDRLTNALEHLTRGMTIKVTLKTGEQLKGTFTDYVGKRLWIRGAARRTVHRDDILAIEAPKL